MSSGSVALVLGVIKLLLSACGQNMDLSFLKETLRTGVPTARGCAQESDKRKRTERRMNGTEAIGNDNVCETISPWQGPPHPEGGLGATRLQPQCSLRHLSPMTPSSHHTAKALQAKSVQDCAFISYCFLILNQKCEGKMTALQEKE